MYLFKTLKKYLFLWVFINSKITYILIEDYFILGGEQMSVALKNQKTRMKLKMNFPLMKIKI